MIAHSDIASALICPRCSQARLAAAHDAYHCAACATIYPILGGVPCLVPDPALFQLGWRARLAAYGSMIDASVRGIAQQRKRESVPPRTRERLLRVMGAIQEQRQEVERLMAAVVAGGGQLPLPALPARTDAEAGLSVLHHYENVFRDWAWGEAEAERQRRLVQRLGPGEGIRRLAVYGAGAGRLAYDLHQHLRATHTFALDINPLPLAIARQLTEGKSVELPEFPVAPRADDQVTVRHLLRAPAVARPGLTFMFADALTPPFPADGLDVVVTPWFIDVVGADLSVTVAAINRVLRPGGIWLNLGPLLFKGDIAGQYAIGEVLDIVKESGFELRSQGSDAVPYFQSPHSGSSRSETVFWFGAVKAAGPAAAKRPPAVQPPWLRDPRLPVPVVAELTEIRQSSAFTAAVLSMIDGKSSLAEMAAQAAPSWNTDQATAENHLRAFFASFFGDPGLS